MTDDKGQMILLSAITVFAFLAIIAAMIISSGEYCHDRSNEYLSQYTLDNAIEVHEDGLAYAAKRSSNLYRWEDRHLAVDIFKGMADRVDVSLSANLLRHGVAFRSSYDGEMSADHAGSLPAGYDSIGGVIVKEENGSTIIYGYAYDVLISDGKACHEISRLCIFE